MHLNSASIYKITQVILAFWLVLAYDLLEDRRTDDDSARFTFFWIFWILNLNNHNSLLSIATNQFASFFIDIRSRQCSFRVCQSGEIWNKRAFFACILIFLLYKTNRFHVAVRLFSNRSRRTSKCGKNISDTFGCARVPLFYRYHILTSSVIYYWTDARQHGIYLWIRGWVLALHQSELRRADNRNRRQLLNLLWWLIDNINSVDNWNVQ